MLRIAPRAALAPLIAAFIGLWLLALTPLPAQAQDTLVLGRISDDPKAHYARMKPLLDYVVARMGDVGISHGRVLMARTDQQMVSYLRQGKVDWMSETAGAALGLANRTNARIVLRARRGGLSDYHSVFFARKQTAIRGLADLPGRVIGFQHPLSTSAYLAPAALLLEGGLNLAIQSSPLERPPAHFVGYVFARSESNLVTWVQKALVDAAVISNQDWQELVLVSPELTKDLAIFHRSSPFPRAFELVGAGMPTHVELRLREILLNAHRDPAATAALEAYQRTEQFDTVDAQTLLSLDRLRAGVARVRREIE